MSDIEEESLHPEEEKEEEEEEVEQEPSIVFALTPGQAKLSSVLDMNDKLNHKLYELATSPMTPKFDCTPNALRIFLENMQLRAQQYGWNDILEIPLDPTLSPLVDQQYIHLIHKHGLLSLEQVRAHVRTYIHTQTRAAQDANMMGQCIYNTLTAEGKTAITLFKDEYMFGEIIGGPCLLKVVIRESHIDTNATVRLLRKQLKELDQYIVKIDSDIIKFNKYVNTTLHGLHSRGATTLDLMTNLFDAYAQASDKQFVKYIQTKKDLFDDGELNITPQILMLKAATKYKTMKDEETWNAPSDEQVEIMALKAQVSKLEIANKKSKKTQTSSTSSKSTKKDEKSNKTKKKRYPPWRYVAPKEGESQKKTVNNRNYFWCPHHKLWTAHDPNKCNMNKKKRKFQDDTGDNSSNPTGKRVKINASLAQIMNGNSDSDTEMEE